MGPTIIVTGGAGFIGSEVVRQLLSDSPFHVVTIDKLTYAGSLATLADIRSNPRHTFIQADIADQHAMAGVFQTHEPAGIFHLAAESHVDRSIDSSSPFIQTNMVGTHVLLEAARQYWSPLSDRGKKERFRFLHVSTDEVYGTLGPFGIFDETSPYQPNSPYAASKAGSDMLARAWFHTYGLPVVITNCTNNYGPYQFPEKLIPLTIRKCISGQPIPVYGKGDNIRDWLYVADHVRALRRVFSDGTPGETYCISAQEEKTNLDLVRLICDIMDDLHPAARPYRDLIHHVSDRPGHDFRYALNPAKLREELGWRPLYALKPALTHTITWYLENSNWINTVTQDRYQGERLGTVHG